MKCILFINLDIRTIKQGDTKKMMSPVTMMMMMMNDDCLQNQIISKNDLKSFLLTNQDS